MTTRRLRTSIPNRDAFVAIDSQQTTVTKANTFTDMMKSIGILFLLFIIVFIGFQTAPINTIYDEIHKNDQEISFVPQQSTPSPTQASKITVFVHEDDGDIEIDVPQQIPPNIMKETPQTPQTPQTPHISENATEHIITEGSVTMKQQNMTARQNLLQKINKKRSKRPNQTNNKYRNKGLINIKMQYHDPQEENIILPSIEQMSQNKSRRFYSDIETPASIYGFKQHCNHCIHRKFAIISGLYNTGTNVALRLINQNCRTALKFQPGWGKHEMFNDTKIEHFNTHYYNGNMPGLYDHTIFVIVVKDPLTWMKSMCKANYDFIYTNRTWFFEDCPTHIQYGTFNWIPMNRGLIMNRGKNRTSNGAYQSPMHLWNDWISSVIHNVDGNKWPHLIVRYEDLLFKPKNVVQQFCGCLGECTFRKIVDANDIKMYEEASKPHGNPRNRTMSFWAYSNPEYRYEGYTKDDLQYILDTIDHSLLEIFGYEFDVDKTKRMRL